MKSSISSLCAVLLAGAATAHAEPILTSWFTDHSSVLARVIQTTSTSNGTKNTNYVNGTTTYSRGRYVGDYDFLGDRGQTQGPAGTFDLDQYNGRTCKTPEFPNGTYASFVTIDAAGNPAFPYMLGKQYHGIRNGTAQNVSVPTTGVTEYFNGGGTNLVETWSDAPALSTGTGNVTITWSSVEGGTYKVEASGNLTTWTTLSPSVPAPANTILPAPPDVITETSITDPAAVSTSAGKRFYKVTRNP